MWQPRSPRTQGDRLWHYVADLRRGDDHDPEEEFRSLLPTARLVSEALKGGGEGPEALSEARLVAAIGRSEDRKIGARRSNWALPSLAAAGWLLTTLSFCLLSYQSGLNHGSTLVRQAEDAALPGIARAVTDDLPPVPDSKIAIRKMGRTRPSSRHDRRRKMELASVPSAPAVRVDELDPNAGEAEPASTISVGAEVADSAQNNLMRVGSSQLTQGQWDKAASTFEEAASQKPEDESALDALHLSGTIAQTALNDPKRAGEMYRREESLARRIIERRKGDRDVPADPVKMRLARAMTSAGLLERNPIMIQKATQESSASGTPSNASN